METTENNPGEKPNFTHGSGFIILIVVGVIALLTGLKFLIG